MITFREFLELAESSTGERGKRRLSPKGPKGSRYERTAQRDDTVDRIALKKKTITLTQDPDKGKKAKLAKFYKSHGFQSNRGRSRDFTTRDTHIRHPKQQEAVDYERLSSGARAATERAAAAKKAKLQRQQSDAEAARTAFRTKGVPFSDAKGSGHIVNGKKVYAS